MMTPSFCAFFRSIALVVATLSVSALGAPGDPDLSFNGTGRVATAVGNGEDTGLSVAVQPDGKIVIVGTSFNGSNLDLALVRYLPNGTLDSSFGAAGKVTTSIGSGDEYGVSVAVQADGKIVAAGQVNTGSRYDFAVVRYRTDGSLDPSFGSGGKVTTSVGNTNDYALKIVLQTDGKLIVIGQSYNPKNSFGIVRYNADGSLDLTFNGTGRVITPINGINDRAYGAAIQNDGKIVVAGATQIGSLYDFAVLRYNADGILDTTFNGTGKVVTDLGGNDIGHGVAVQSDGKIVVTGSGGGGGHDQFATLRYNANGTLDSTFNGTGKVLTVFGGNNDSAGGLVVQSDGKLIVTGNSYNGSSYELALARYNADGTLDSGFGSGGKVTAAIPNGSSNLALQSDGRIVLAASSSNGSNFDFAALRYLASDAPSAATASATGVSGTGVTLRGAVNPAGVVATVYFEFGATALYGNVTPVQNLAAGSSVVDVSAPLSGLTPGGTYHYRIVASNAGGTVRGSDVSFQATATGGESPSAAPVATTGVVSGVSSTGVTIAGTVNPNGGTTLAQVEYGLTASYGSVSTPEQNVGNGTLAANVALPLSGLKPLTTYHYRVIASNSVGSGHGEDATFTTDGIPPEVHTLAATNVASTSATLNAQVTANTGAASVLFFYGTSASVLDQVAAVPSSVDASGAAQNVSVILPKGTLAKSATYFFRAIALSGAGTTTATEVLSFTTQNAPPVALDDTVVILGDGQLDPLKQFDVTEPPGRDSDPDDDVLHIVGDPTGAQLGTPKTSLDGLKITYTPGDTFAGNVDGDSFTYTVSDGNGGTAQALVRVYSVRTFKGLYSGLIGGAGGADVSGRLDVTVTATGQVTGSFTWQAQVYPFKGAALDASGKLTVTRLKTGLPSGQSATIEISLQLDPLTHQLSGRLTDTSTTPATVVQATVTGTAGVEDSGDLPDPGVYVSYIDPGAAPFAPREAAPESGGALLVLPKGVGYTRITIAKGAKRQARFGGRMPDDQPYTSGAQAFVQALRAASGNPRYAFYNDTLYGKTRTAGLVQSRGVVSGDVAFAKVGGRFDSSLNWERRANVGNRFPAGFRTGVAGLTAALNAVRYGVPRPGNLPVGIRNDGHSPNAKIEIRDGDLPTPPNLIVHSLRLTRSGALPIGVKVEPGGVVLNVEKLKLAINPAAGTFSGTFIHPGSSVITKFTGVFKDQDGQGVFTGPVTTGRIQILAQ